MDKNAPVLDKICPVCGAANAEQIGSYGSVYSERFYQLVSCAGCTHVFIADRPTSAELDRIYGKTYNYEAHLAVSDEKRWRVKQTFARLSDVIPKNAKVVDVGCMYGFALEELRTLGYKDLAGVEIHPQAAEWCRKQGFDVYNGNFEGWLKENAARKSGMPVCLIFSHVIEHFIDVKAAVSSMAQNMEKGEYLVIFVPNSGSWTAKLFGRFWGWWQVPVHINHFTPRSLKKLMNDGGFSSVRDLRFGADSLFWLLIVSTMLGMKSIDSTLTAFRKLVIRITSRILRYWYYAGDEEIVSVFRKD